MPELRRGARTWLAADRGSVFVYHDAQEPVRHAAIAAAGDSHDLKRGFVRSIILSCALCLAVLCVACQKSAEEKKREQAELDAWVARKLTNEKLAEAHEREEHDRASRWADIVRAEEVGKESAETFAKFKAERQDTTNIDEARILDAMVARVRRLMGEPDTMQVRYVRFNAARSAVCMEINYRDDGRYVGFRQVYVTPNEVMVEPRRDDVSHRVFELSQQAIACGPTPEEAISK